MRRALLPLLFILTLLACKESRPTYTLEGKCNSGDTLLIFGIDSRWNNIDTIISDEEGHFAYSIETDTIVPLKLLLPGGEIFTLYASPNQKASLLSDTLSKSGYTIKGGDIQSLHDSIVAVIDSIGNSTKALGVIDNFIKAHPYSDVNIHIITHYLAHIKEPKSSLIKERINSLGGTLQDNERIREITRKTDSKQENVIYRSFPDFDITLADSSKRINSDYRDKHLVVTFWASWDSASVRRLKEFRKLKALEDTAHFALLNISFDYDTAAWRRSLALDSIPGDNYCDTKAWDNEIAKNYTINELPYSIHVNPYQRTNKFGIDEQFIQEHMDSLINKLKDEIKKRKERERKRELEEKKKKEQEKKKK